MNKKVKVFIFAEIIYGLIGNYILLIVYCILTSLKSGRLHKLSPDILNPFVYIGSCNIDLFFWQFFILGNILILVFPVYLAFVYEPKGKIMQTGLIKVTDQISIPVPAGSGQFGRQRFMTYEDLDNTKEIKEFVYQKSQKKVPDKGGIVIGIHAIGDIPSKSGAEHIMCICEDRHILLVGATRSGKSRRIILESIWFTLKAGENMLINDPKGELYAYTSPFAKDNGYQVVAIDFRNPNKGTHYNYMEEIISAIDSGNVAEAVDLTWDLVSVLVGDLKGEPIWHNGECATIAASILIVATEAPKEYRNLTNVYYFLANMAKPDPFGEMPITRYLSGLDDTHPAKAVFAMAEIAHPKTRGSFFSSALGTLKHFTNPKIAEMTGCTDYTFEQMAHEKTIVYIILPDEKKTLYSLASIYIMQQVIYNTMSTFVGGFPMAAAGLNDKDGYVIGEARNRMVVMWNMWLRGKDRTNSNVYIQGIPGTGKSTLIKFFQLLEYAINDTTQIVWDAEREFIDMARHPWLNADVIDCASGNRGRSLLYNAFTCRCIGSTGEKIFRSSD